MIRFSFIFIFLFAVCLQTVAQVSKQSVYWHDEKDRSISIQFDNDTYYYTDYYYTNGLELEVVLPVFNRTPLSFIFPKISENQNLISGLSLVHRLYTPKNIRDTLIQFNDRPFAATLEVNHFMRSQDPLSGASFTGRLCLGIMGPAAGGDAFHNKIHDWIQSPGAEGWDYQIANDIIINYDFQMYYPFLYNPSFTMGLNGNLRVGTLFDDIGIGLHLAAGKKQLKQDEKSQVKHRYEKPHFFISADADYKLVVYNATLQGGLLSKNDPYVLSYEEVYPYVLSAHASAGILWYGISMSYAHNFISKEFYAGTSHNYGSFILKIGF